MKENKIFYIEKEGIKYQATILTNFEVYGDNYCIYTVPDKTSHQNNVYCAKIIDNNLVEIKEEKERKITTQIIKQLMHSV